jgi:ferritin-like metal-binding protein YciE
MTALEEKLVEYIDDAYDGAERAADARRHDRDDEGSTERYKKQADEHGASPSKAKEAGGMMAALMKSVIDAARHDSPGRNARDGFATEHLEIASYQMLERVAKKAGDKHTAAVARQNREEEEQMARSINAKWNKIVELSLKEEGITAS